MDFANKATIQNRHGLSILVKYFPTLKQNAKLAIIQHGFSGSMEEDHIKAFGETYLKNDYNVLMMDCTHSFNDADGSVDKNTIQSHYEDLEDVIKWASHQAWYQEPFALAGHSLGGLAIVTYASKNPKKISSLFPAATLISGQHLEEANLAAHPKEYNEFKSTGKMEIECGFNRNLSGYRPYSWIETMWNWNALDYAPQLSMPVLLIVGSKDDGTPPEHQKLLFDKLPNDKEMHIIQNTDHCYIGKINEVTAHLDQWIKAHD